MLHVTAVVSDILVQKQYHDTVHNNLPPTCSGHFNLVLQERERHLVSLLPPMFLVTMEYLVYLCILLRRPPPVSHPYTHFSIFLLLVQIWMWQKHQLSTISWQRLITCIALPHHEMSLSKHTINHPSNQFKYVVNENIM